MTLYTISRPPRAFSLVKHKVVTSRGSCCIYCGGLFRGTELNQRSLMSLVSCVLIPCLWRTMNDLLPYIRDCLSSGNHAEQYVAKTGQNSSVAVDLIHLVCYLGPQNIPCYNDPF